MRISSRNLPGWMVLHILALPLFLLSCLNENGKSDGKDTDPTVAVEFQVLDAGDGSPVPGVQLSVAGVGDLTTGEDGSVRFEVGREGDHPVLLEKAGYAATAEVVHVSGPEWEAGSRVFKTRKLHKSNLVIKGRLLAFVKAGDAASPAPGMRMEVHLPDPFRIKTVTALTDEEGRYEFTGLPEAAECSLSVAVTRLDAYQVRMESMLAARREAAKGEITIPDRILEILGTDSFDILPGSLSGTGIDLPVTLDFSHPVDTAPLATGAILMEWEGFPFYITSSWSKSNTRLTVAPASGPWPPSGSLDLVLTGLRDLEGAVLPPQGSSRKVRIRNSPYVSEGLPASVDSVWLRARVPLVGWWNRAYPYVAPDTWEYVRTIPPEDSTIWIDTNTIDYWTDRYTLHWRKSDKARYYEIHQRSDSRSTWRRIALIGPDTTYTVVFDSGIDTRPMRRQHRVVAGNGDGLSSLGSAAELDVQDGMSPGIFAMALHHTFPNGAAFFPITDSRFYNRERDSDYVASIHLDLEHIANTVPMEPLDTSLAPTVRIVEGWTLSREQYSADPNYRPEFLSFTWISRSAAIIRVRVAAGKSGLYDHLVVDFTGLKDLSGNLLLGNPGQHHPELWQWTRGMNRPFKQTPVGSLTHRFGGPVVYE
jgi:hypothetical protein